MTSRANVVREYPNEKLPLATVGDVQPHSDLTFKVFDDLVLEDVNLHQSLLNGCLVRNCVFRRARLSRCDLEQIQFQNCRFEDVDFGNVELTSAQIVGTVFQNCNFESALITDSVWANCTLEGCSFQQAVIHDCQFDKCVFKSGTLRGSSFQLDAFRKCIFEDIKLGDCTFLNHIITGCAYKGVIINGESIGSLFGITERDLLACDLVYLGQPVIGISGAHGLIDALEKDYEQRRWFFMREIMRLNFGRVPPALGLEACLKAVLWPASMGMPLKVGDITFLEMIVSELSKQKRLPAMAAITIPETIQNFQERYSSQDAERSDQSRLRQLASRMQAALLELLQQLVHDTEGLIADDRPVTAKLVFDRKPDMKVADFIQEIGKASGFRIQRRSVLLQEGPGSYYAILQTSLATIAAFQTALWLLNGCVAQVIELKSRVQIAVQKRPPKVIRDRVLLPDQNIPKWMVVTVQSIFSKLTADPSRLKQIGSDFSADNLKRIEVDESQPKRPRQSGETKR